MIRGAVLSMMIVNRGVKSSEQPSVLFFQSFRSDDFVPVLSEAGPVKHSVTAAAFPALSVPQTLYSYSPSRAAFIMISPSVPSRPGISLAFPFPSETLQMRRAGSICSPRFVIFAFTSAVSPVKAKKCSSFPCAVRFWSVLSRIPFSPLSA